MELLWAKHNYIQKNQMMGVGSGFGVSRCDEYIQLVKEGKAEEPDSMVYTEHESPCMPEPIKFSITEILMKSIRFCCRSN